MAANHQHTIVLNVDKKQLKALFKDLGLVQKRIQKINQTGLQLNRVRSRTRNIRGTGLNLSTNQDRQARDNASPRVKRQVEALNNANKALNKYVRSLRTADGAQRGFTGSTNKISTQVSALRDRLRGLSRSNSEYTSTLQAVQRGEQALFQDRNKRLGDQSRTLGSRGGNKDLVTDLINQTDITQSIDGLNNYISRLEALKNKVNINSREFRQLENRIAEVNIQLNESQLLGQSSRLPRPARTSSGSPGTTEDQINAIKEQRLAIENRIKQSQISQGKKEELITQLNKSNLAIDKQQLRTAKEINIQTQKNLANEEKLLRASTRRASILKSTLIGGGFPLLFGGGPLQAIGGAIGGGVGEALSPGGGVAGSFAATALISSMQKFADSARDVGNALKDANLGLDKLKQLGFEVDQATQKQIESLIQVGKVRQAETIINQKFAEMIGTKGVISLMELDSAFDELQREASRLFLTLSSELAPAFITIVNLAKDFINTLTGPAIQRAAANTDPQAFQDAMSRAASIASPFGAFGDKQLYDKLLTDFSQDILKKNAKDITTGKTPGGTGGGSQDFSKFDLNVLNKRIALQKVGDDLLNEEVVRKRQALIIAEQALAIAQAQGDAGKIAIANKTAELKTNELNTAVDEKRQNLIDNTIGKLQEEKLFLEESLTLGEDKAQIEKTIRDLVKDLPPERHAEVRALVEGNEALKERNKILDEQKATQEEIKNILAGGMTNAVMGLIEGSKTLGQVLADVAKQLASMFLNKAFSSIFSSFGGGGGGMGGGALPPAPIYVAAQGGFSRSGGFKAFQQGGVVNSPIMGLIGEGGESEYVIPASKMDGAMARYSAGARGGAVIPGGSGDPGTVAGSSGNTVVEYTGPTLNFNGDEYVPKSAVPEIIGAAAKRGAQAGKAQAFGSLKNSRSQRASLGL